MSWRREGRRLPVNVTILYYGVVLFLVLFSLNNSHLQTGKAILAWQQPEQQQQETLTPNQPSAENEFRKQEQTILVREGIIEKLQERAKRYKAQQSKEYNLSNDEDTTRPLTRPPLPYTPEPDYIPTGILSNKPKSFFDEIRFRIDNVHPYDRCRPYSFLKKGTKALDVVTTAAKRRIFFGALIADEPRELLEIIATETYEIFTGIVFVESNRTQHFMIRPLQRQGQEDDFRKLFGTPKIQIRTYVNENSYILDLAREHEQRQEILIGWKELGMTKDDIGYLADIDETYTRDFLRALQECPHIEFVDYNNHRCHPLKARINGASRVFEASPDCIAKRRTWHHPDAIMGACIELIGNTTLNPIAPRQYQFERAEGYANNCRRDDLEGYKNITENNRQFYPLYNAADFRRMCGGTMIRNRARAHTEFTGYHFHNFFASFNQTRFKYKTYGHPQYGAFTSKLEDLHKDTALVSQCVNNISNAESLSRANEEQRKDKNNNNKKEVSFHEREEGGLEATLPPWPVYFFDKDYRERKFQFIRDDFVADEISRQAYVKARKDAELARRAKLLRNSKILSV